MQLTTLEFLKVQEHVALWNKADVAIAPAVYVKCLAALREDPFGAYTLGKIHYFEYLLAVVENLNKAPSQYMDESIRELLAASLVSETSGIEKMYSAILHSRGLKGTEYAKSLARLNAINGPDSAFGKDATKALQKSGFEQLSNVLKARLKTEKELIGGLESR
ncbi:hypothetical protein SARC_05770 [Sphaeroforma arctica JP610]|uniref:Uncharacterized protein n=1 Tax=Sphaeroforma arctica JP610 TaxID=667725 RepID=A0A0L0FZ56_9EUKA|nr:hypothetical protein SARC_05770 [Sphaeroforma arctica JP610]KNC81919.1 hypothetical protein SARC_05770 [Sphaeroforma arctica JP610]|eukprot:XP_014155821.1 hypothetical protein SARC_05770 [Sphaeroforma arctica JP610]